MQTLLQLSATASHLSFQLQLSSANSGKLNKDTFSISGWWTLKWQLESLMKIDILYKRASAASTICRRILYVLVLYFVVHNSKQTVSYTLRLLGLIVVIQVAELATSVPFGRYKHNFIVKSLRWYHTEPVHAALDGCMLPKGRLQWYLLTKERIVIN